MEYYIISFSSILIFIVIFRVSLYSRKGFEYIPESERKYIDYSKNRWNYVCIVLLPCIPLLLAILSYFQAVRNRWGAVALFGVSAFIIGRWALRNIKKYEHSDLKVHENSLEYTVNGIKTIIDLTDVDNVSNKGGNIIIAYLERECLIPDIYGKGRKVNNCIKSIVKDLN